MAPDSGRRAYSPTRVEVDDMSLQSAARNIDANGLQDRIALVRAVPDGPILLPLFQRYDEARGQGNRLC